MFERHKRSKSSLALSILHRTKTTDNDDDTTTAGSSAGSPSASPTISQYGSLRSQPYIAATVAEMKPMGEGQNMGSSIEHSVRMFRLFEILRSGDRAAVSKAAKGNSEKGSPEQALQGTTILHLAIQCAEPSVVEHILSTVKSDPDVNLDLNAQDREGNTPLHLGSMLGRTTIVHVLLAQSSIDSSILNYSGRSPLDLARTPEIFQQLQLARAIFTDAQVQSIHRLVAREEYEELKALLEQPRVAAVVDVNGAELATDAITVETGGTLLHEAARKKDIRLIQLLLLHGADPFKRDRKGKLPQDVTKDDKTRTILKKSPAAAAAQRGIQEKAILGSALADKAMSSKESREMKGYLKKWTNYTTGYKLRWFVLEDGVLSYYKHQGGHSFTRNDLVNFLTDTL